MKTFLSILMFSILILSRVIYSGLPGTIHHEDFPVEFNGSLFGCMDNYRDAAFTPDQKEFYFTWIKDCRFTIMVSYKINGKWTIPSITLFSGAHDDFEPVISFEGDRFYFASKRPGPEKPEMKNDIDIWVMEREGEQWGKPQRLPSIINTDCMEYFPSVTRKGALYFGRNNREMTRGDIFVSRVIEGKYTKPVKLDDTVNLKNTSFNAFIAPDESYMIFSTYIDLKIKPHSDLFISFRKSKGWSVPVNLGDKINSHGNDHAPMVTRNGKFLYFASTRNDKTGSGRHAIFRVSTDFVRKLK